MAKRVKGPGGTTSNNNDVLPGEVSDHFVLFFIAFLFAAFRLMQFLY